MVTERRRERERQSLRQAILIAATRIAAEDGWQAVTIRKIAERVEYTPPVIYEHFESKEAILLELKREGFAQLVAAMQQAQAAATQPEEAILRTVAAYCEFAWRYPELYQAMNGMAGVSYGLPEELSEQKDQMFTVVRAAFANLVPGECAPWPELDEAVQIVWGLAHGIISLALAGRLPGGNEAASTLIQQGVRALLTNLVLAS